jgi:hypothetical protein
VIFIIVAIGIIQDALFRLIDRLLFRFKHQ